MNGPGLCSIHTHSVCCDGKSTLAEMAAAAYAAGVRYFGASGHSHTPIPADQGNVLPEDWTPYKQEVLRLRQEYAGRMEVLLGIDWDSCAQQPMPEGLDYWIGSVHDLRGGSPGCYYCVDWDRRMLEDCCRELFHGDFRGVYRQYYADVAEMAGRRPPVLGHIDLITKLNGDGGLFDEDSGDYRQAALDALHAADPAATLLEINTGAISRGYRRQPYPAQLLLREWRRMGGQVILTADAHWADAIVYGYEQAAAWAREAGYRESVLLTLEGWRTVPL